MEIGKGRADAREGGPDMLTPEDARELGLGPDAPGPEVGLVGLDLAVER